MTQTFAPAVPVKVPHSLAPTLINGIEPATIITMGDQVGAVRKSFFTAGGSASVADSFSTWGGDIAHVGMINGIYGRPFAGVDALDGRLSHGWPITSHLPEEHIGGIVGPVSVGSNLLGRGVDYGRLGGSTTRTPPAPSPLPFSSDEVYRAVLDSGRTAVNVSGLLVSGLSSASNLARVLGVNFDPVSSYGAARRLADASRSRALRHIRRSLEDRRAVYTLTAPANVASELGDTLGLGQLSIARAIGVTPTAVRKWRRGEGVRAEYRDRLSSLAALTSELAGLGVHDPASWLEIPVSEASELTPLDLFIGGRADLVVLSASGNATPQETLDLFDPTWRLTTSPDPDYEIVTLSDGSRSAVPRRDGERA